jgi:alcohol dehydrogenase (cytochrome c)
VSRDQRGIATRKLQRPWHPGSAGIGAFALMLCFEGGGSHALAQQSASSVAGFNVAQTISGKPAYDAHCASCHGADLSGAGPAVALRGSAFVEKWSNKPANELFAAVRRMPPGQPDAVSAIDAANIIAFILESNGLPTGLQAFPAAEEPLSRLTIPMPGAATASQPRQPVVIAPRGASRLDRLTPVTADALRQPSPDDWLHWRRTYDASGFSPLDQVNQRNVAKLGLAWSWSLPRGDNMMTPIVHDGVMFALSHGDVLEALDAASGELLWRYERKIRPGATFHGKKGVAIHGENIFVPTSDMHVLALNARTGALVWDHAVDTDGQFGFQMKSSPLIADGRVILGINGYTGRGGNFIIALDLATGAEVWRFRTIAQPGEPHGDSWNGQPLANRTGGSVWVAGTYDPALNLVYFGAAPTYNTAPLRELQPGVTNDALYTNATIALNPNDGTLAWFFQHQKNDQLDHDWAFERQLVDLKLDGSPRRVVVTAGKQAIFEALDAASGKYQFSIDLGMQNVITAIDPRTGAKTLNPSAVPASKQVLQRITLPGICPDLLGARNLMSGAYDSRTSTLYVPLTDTCLQPWPNGKQWQKHPDDSIAGMYGAINAVNLQSREAIWTVRERAAPVSGALVTAGDLMFVGDADRWFRAYDTQRGKTLWKVRLDNVPASYPITYRVNGRQYVTVATNEGYVHVQAMQRAGKITPQPNRGATLWTFALPDE